MFGLRPAEPSDAEFMAEVRNSDETYLQLHDAEMYSAEKTAQWLRSLPDSSRRFILLVPNIELRQELEFGVGDTKLGVVRIDRIDHTNRNCYVGMDLHPNARGKRLAEPAYRILLPYLFNNLNFNALYLEVLETNPVAIHVYKKLGFQTDGLIPQRTFRGGQYIDAIHMSLLRKDFS